MRQYSKANFSKGIPRPLTFKDGGEAGNALAKVEGTQPGLPGEARESA